MEVCLYRLIFLIIFVIVMKPFLKSLAEGYVTRYQNPLQPRPIDLSEICFVFPNKRAGAFFLKYLAELTSSTVLAPEITNITDFVTMLSGRQMDSRLDMLIQLYKCYVRLLAPDTAMSDLPDTLSFDNFRIWGDTVLRDFSDVDMHDVDASEIFSNLNDFRTIATDYLTDEQKEVVEQYFGKQLYESTDKFWREFTVPPVNGYGSDEENEDYDKTAGAEVSEPLKKPGKARNKFIYLWQILSPLYDLFTARLDNGGLATPGRVYRMAKERLEEYGRKIIPYRKVVMVGFNALSASERGIFAALRDIDDDGEEYDGDSFADFVWDSTGPILSDRDNPAGRFVAVNRKKFPEPAWLKPFMAQSDTNELPQYMEQIASPSNALQAKIAGEELKDMYVAMENAEKGSGVEVLNEARVAVVLPDESLLIPVLYGLPSVLGAPNLTMGYPLKETSLSTFVALLRNVQTTQRYSKGGRGFGSAELYRFFAHPLTHAILGTSVINRFKNDMISKRRLVVTQSDMKDLSDRAKRLLSPISSSATIGEVSSYMNEVLEMVAEAMSGGRSTLVRNSLEYEHARMWQQALSHLTDVVRRYEVEMKPTTFLYEAERLLTGETVPFTGVPLEGLQIMGLLETRLLDFEHIIVLSMNDKIMPQRVRQRTFIPDSLRRGYGMPPSNYQETIFSYHFYRLISRAKTVRLVYDARIGLSGGGPSRYLHQLDMLYARGILKHSERKLPVGHVLPHYESSGKNDNALAVLDRYKAGAPSPKVFSATSLKKYCVCPLKFYLEVIWGIRTDIEDGEKMSAIMYGDIFHKLMERVYMPEGYHAQEALYEIPIRVTGETIEKLLDDRDGLHRMVCRTINEMYYKLDGSELDTPLPPASAIIAEGLLLQLESALRHDLRLSPFELLGCETGGDLSYQVNDDLMLNVRFKIDRIDRVSVGRDESGRERYEVRLVDYKTGYVDVMRNSFEEFFVNMPPSDATFQLMFYAEMLSRWPQWRKRYGDCELALIVYDMRKPNRVNELRLPMISGREVSHYNEVRDEFNTGLRDMLSEIYRPDKVFEAMPEDTKCNFCSFKVMCHRS